MTRNQEVAIARADTWSKHNNGTADTSHQAAKAIFEMAGVTEPVPFRGQRWPRDPKSSWTDWEKVIEMIKGAA